MKRNKITIGAYQDYAIYENVSESICVIRKAIDWAEEVNVGILCFPECFLQGYILDSSKARHESIDLGSKKFRDILKVLYSHSVTIILGLIEKDKDSIFNTAVVIENGKLIGKYRKQHLLNKEALFAKGSDDPVFQKNGVRFGINICYDTRFPESSKALVEKGAKILFYPVNSSLPQAVAGKWKNKHMRYWKQRAKENHAWVVVADVIEKSDTNIGYGFTRIIDPDGIVIDSVPHLQPGKIKHSIAL